MVEADIYTRVSTTRQAEQGSSLDSQEKSCAALALSQGITVSRVFREDWTGAELSRPQLDLLRQDVRARTIQAVITHSTDRLSRNPIHLAILAEEAAKHNVELLFVTEPLDSTPEGQLIRYIKGYASQIEREKIRERSMRGKRERALKGKLLGGTDLYGYDYVRGKEAGQGIRVIDEDEAYIVRSIFRWVVEEDLTIPKIHFRLIEMGIPSPRGKERWGTSSIARLLHNASYTGKTYANTQRVTEPITRKSDQPRRKNSGREFRDKSEWIELPDNTPAIIDMDTFEEAAKTLGRHFILASRNAKYHYLLRGHVYCEYCNQAMYGMPTPRDYHYYRCRYKVKTITDQTCPNRYYQAEKLEVEVWDAVREALLKPDIIMQVVRQRYAMETVDTTQTDLHSVTARIGKLKNQETGLVRHLGDDSLDQDLLLSQLKLLKKERDGFERERGLLEVKVKRSTSLEAVEAQITTFCEKARVNIESFTFEDKRDTMEAISLKVWVNREKWWAEGLLPIVIGSSGPRRPGSQTSCGARPSAPPAAPRQTFG